MRIPAMTAFLAAAVLVLIAAPTAGATAVYGPCSQAAEFQCTTVAVPLDRSGQVPGTIQLAAGRKLAPSNPGRVAVLALAGGPGQAATPLARDFAEVLAPALATRDLLVFDQRGTGASSALQCRLLGRTLTDAARDCANQLGAVRGLFRTSDSVEDIETLRAESGYEKLVLYGVSYGTKVALDYAARYPARVESLVLDSVVLPVGPDPLQRSTFAAMRRVLSELCAGSECRGIARHPTDALAAEVKRLHDRLLHGRLTTGSGRRIPAAMDGVDLLNIMLTGDLNPTLRAELPGALTSARRGDTAPLIRLAARSADLINLGHQAAGDFNDGVFLATICEEGAFPWDRAATQPARVAQARAAVRALGNGPFRPFDTYTALSSEVLNLCVGWPTATPPAVPAGPLPAVPTLVVDGRTDLRTPLEDADKVRALIPGAQVLYVPFTGHSVLASEASAERCAERAIGQFFAAQAVTPCTTTDNPFSPTPVAPTRLDRLHGTGSAGKVGRTVTAVISTLADVRRQVIGDALQAGRLPRRVGGLRGGRTAVSASERLSLRDVVYIPGVEVSGGAHLRGGLAHLRIRGRSAARGRLAIGATQISGHLGGRRVRLVARAAGAGAAAARVPDLDALLRRFRLRRAG